MATAIKLAGVNAMSMLVQQLETVSVRLHHSAADLSPEELVERPLPGVNPIAFLIWHMARSQDWAVNTAIQGVPELIMREPWSKSALAVPGIGTGFALEEAAAAASRFQLADLLRYADDVHADTLAWVRTIDETVLDEIPDVAGHGARHPEYQTPGFRAEMDSGPEHDEAVGSRGGLPVWIFVTSVSITHLHRHLGELDLVKDLLRRRLT